MLATRKTKSAKNAQSHAVTSAMKVSDSQQEKRDTFMFNLFEETSN